MKNNEYNFYTTTVFIFELTLCLLNNEFENNYEPFPIKKKIIITSSNC